MSSVSLIKDQLLSQGINHFVIFTENGTVVERSGDFEDTEKQRLAYTIVQQASLLLETGEALKGITMSFDNVAYVATTIREGQECYGVLAKRPTGAITPMAT